MYRLILLIGMILLPVSAWAGCVTPPNWGPPWKSYQTTGDPSDIVSSPTVASYIGQAVQASGGMAVNMTDCNPAIEGGTSVNLTLTTPKITNGTDNNLTLNGLLTFLNGGTIQSIYHEVPALNAEIALGTAAAPITTMGPSLRVSRTEQLATTDCENTYNNNECNAAVAGIAVGTASDMMQTTGIYGGAIGSQTYLSDSQSTDNVGVQGQGREIGQGTGAGTGAFFQGINESPAGRAVGAEINIKNLSGADAAANISNGDGYPVLLLSCGAGTWPSQWKCGSALQVTYAGSAYQNGVVVTDAIASTGAAFVDNSTGLTGLQLSGHHTNQIAGNNFNVTGSGNLWLGTGYSPTTTTHLTVSSADANQAYFGSTGTAAAFINLDDAGGGESALIQFDDKSNGQWQLGKNASNGFILWSVSASENELSVSAGGPLVTAHGVEYPTMVYDSLPSSPGAGQTVFCTNCYSSSRASSSTKTGILVTYSNSEWEDMIGNTALH